MSAVLGACSSSAGKTANTRSDRPVASGAPSTSSSAVVTPDQIKSASGASPTQLAHLCALLLGDPEKVAVQLGLETQHLQSGAIGYDATYSLGAGIDCQYTDVIQGNGPLATVTITMYSGHDGGPSQGPCGCVVTSRQHGPYLVNLQLYRVSPQPEDSALISLVEKAAGRLPSS